MKALIDGDIIRYSCGFASEKTEYKVTDGRKSISFPRKADAVQYLRVAGGDISAYEKVTTPDPLENCLHSAKLIINKVLDRTKSGEYQIYLTGGGNYREEIATLAPYKGHRPDSRPHWYHELGEYLIKRHGAVVIEGQEADDAMGIAQAPPHTCIASLDKDLDMVEGMHYNWRQDRVYDISPVEGMRNFYGQMLTGDRADNIPGIHGIGPVKAKTLLATARSPVQCWGIVEKTYKDKTKLTREQVIEIGRLLWIRRKEGELWSPPE